MLDLRLPVGIFFLLVGAILGIDGLLHPITAPSVNIVLNRDWGAFLFVFGVLMAFFGWRAQQQRGDTPGSLTPPEEKE